MPDTSQRSTRRGFLGTLTLAAVSSAGCSGLGGTQNRQPGPGASESSGSTATVDRSETPTRTANEAHHDEAHGHTHTDGEEHTQDIEHADHDTEATTGTGLAAFESTLRKWFVDIDSLAVEDGRVRLTYVTKSTRGHELAAGIETVVVSFIQTYSEDWDVAGLDATVIEPSGEEMGYWRTESRWVEPVVEGHETRTALLERTLDTYHGRLTRDHSHEESGPSQNRTESGHQHHNGTKRTHH